MPYTIRKQSCKQSDGDKGSYVLSYTDKKGKKHRNCHTSKKKARGQIAAIEAEGVENNQTTKITLSELRRIIQEKILNEAFVTVSEKIGPDLVKNYIMNLDVDDLMKSADLIYDLKEKLETAKESSPFSIQSPIIDTIKTLDINPSNPNQEEEQKKVSDIMKSLANDFQEYTRISQSRKRGPDIEKMSQDILKGRMGTIAGLAESTLHVLKDLIYEVILEKKSKTKKLATKGNDRDGDGDADFADVMIARMKKGGLSDEEAYEKSRKFDDK